eukprot:COSAG04_NODE_1510_length_6492_cov_11.980291_5_plen_128_part_00
MQGFWCDTNASDSHHTVIIDATWHTTAGALLSRTGPCRSGSSAPAPCTASDAAPSEHPHATDQPQSLTAQPVMWKKAHLRAVCRQVEGESAGVAVRHASCVRRRAADLDLHAAAGTPIRMDGFEATI